MAGILPGLAPQPFRATIKRNLDDGGSALLIVDVVESENVEQSIELTENPVEDGLDVTDHARTKPAVITVTGFMSDAPLTLASSVQGLFTAAGVNAGGRLASGFGPQVGALVGSTAGKLGARLLSQSADPSQTAYQILQDIFSAKQQVQVVTKRKAYNNMIMINLSTPRSAGEGTGLKFVATFKEIRIVIGQTVLLKNLERSAASGAAAKAKLGTQTSTPSGDKIQEKGSVLWKLAQSAYPR